MTTDLCWWGVLIRNSLGASWKCTLRPPAPKCTLFKDFLSIKIFLDMLSLLKAWPLMDEVAVTMLWFDFINIFRIHNQLKCHMIHSFLEKISWRQWLLWLLWQTRQGADTGLWLVSRDHVTCILASDWSLVSCHVPVISRDCLSGDIIMTRRQLPRGEYSGHWRLPQQM